MKGLILAAGKGTRLRPLTYTVPKPLLPIANKPTLVYAIEAMKKAGVVDIGVVVGEQGALIAAKLGNGAALGVSLSYISQPEPKGLGHAVNCADDFICREPFMLYLGDTLYDADFSVYKQAFDKVNPDALILVSPVSDPQRYGIAEVIEDRIIHLEEKPKQPRSNLALAGIYFFGPKVWEVLPHLKPSGRGELEITDAAHMLIEKGADVRAGIYDGWWQDSGTPDYMLQANDYWLAKIKTSIEGIVTPSCRLNGQVVIGKGSKLEGNTVIEGPCIIGNNCQLKDAVIGPNVSLSDGACVTNSTVSRSILMRDAFVVNLGRPLVDALVGQRAQLVGGKGFTLLADDTVLNTD